MVDSTTTLYIALNIGAISALIGTYALNKILEKKYNSQIKSGLALEAKTRETLQKLSDAKKTMNPDQFKNYVASLDLATMIDRVEKW
jgi:H+/gluconate symporter-like permease